MNRKIKLIVASGLIGCNIMGCDVTSAPPNTESAPQTGHKSAKEIRGATPYFEISNEPEPMLFVDPPLPHLLAKGVVWIQWRVENVHIAPVFGKAALHVSPRLGHLHVQVDDLPWWWADPGDINTIDMAGLPAGPHKVKISLVNANHQLFAGQSRIISFTIPEGATGSHSH